MNNNVKQALCQSFSEFNAIRNFLLRKFASRPFHSECCHKVGLLLEFFRIYKYLNLFCNSLHVLLVLVSFLVRDAVDSKINRVFKAPPSAKCDSDGIGLESHICNFFSVSRGKRRALELL